MSYCIIGKVKLTQIEGAKTLQLAHFGGLTFAVGKSFVQDKLYAIFLPDGQLSEEYFDVNSEHLGYFGKNRKVRSVKLMGGRIISVGYIAELESLAFTGYDLSQLKEGDSFNELNGVKVCNRFISPEELKAIRAAKHQKNKAKKDKSDKLVIIGMPQHPYTEQFYKFGETLEAGDIITMTLKLDGTSVRVTNAYVELELRWYEKLYNWLMLKKRNLFLDIFGVGYYKGIAPRIINKHFTGTRRVIIQNTSGSGWYGSHAMYLEIGERLEGLLHPGEAVYGEIVGWIDENKPLFVRGKMPFIYGTKPGERDFYVYNIKWTLPDGSQIDLPWNRIKHRCMELGVKHVPEISYSSDIGPARYFEKFYEATFVYDGNITRLENTVYNLVDGDDPIDNTHIREGIVLRVEKAKTGEVKFFKAKSRAFYELENQFKEADGVDIEEVNSIEEDVTGE